MRTQFYEQKVHCVMCGDPVPPEKLRFKSITCSDKCKRERKRMMYVHSEAKECKFCRKPVTRAEQQLWKKFRSFAAKNLDLFFAPQKERWFPTENEREFTFEVAMRMLDRELHEAKVEEVRSGKLGRGPKPGEDGDDDNSGVSARDEVGSADESQGAIMQDTESSAERS